MNLQLPPTSKPSPVTATPTVETSSVSKLRIVIADDHELLRRGMRLALQQRSDWEICGEATNGRQAVEMAEKLSPDVITLDIGMPELNGLEAARQIHKRFPDIEILMVTANESEQMVKDVLEAGARGYILKSDASSLLVSAVEALSQHKPFFTGQIAEMVLGGFLNPAKATSDDVDATANNLTPREREIVQLIAESKSNKETAEKLGISVKTVDAHRANIMRKLKLHSATEVVRYAVRNKIVEV